MIYKKKSFVEHTAIRVKDINWHIRFFEEALGICTSKIGPDHPTTKLIKKSLKVIKGKLD